MKRTNEQKQNFLNILNMILFFNVGHKLLTLFLVFTRRQRNAYTYNCRKLDSFLELLETVMLFFRAINQTFSEI